MKLFQTKIKFLGHEIFENNITIISRVLEFTSKFPDKLRDKNQLHRFLGCLNYVLDFFKDIRILCQPLYDRLKKNLAPWIDKHIEIVRLVKQKIHYLLYLQIPHLDASLIIETDASDIGYGGILKQCLPGEKRSH